MYSPSTTLSRNRRLIVWIRRELRLHDNLPLWNAVQDADEVIPLIILDEEFRSFPQAKQQVVIDGIIDLHHSMQRIGGSLLVREGDAGQTLLEALRESDAAGVYTSCSFEPENRARDATIRALTQADGKRWTEFQDHLLFSPGSVVTRSGTPYTVYTPFKNTCSVLLHDLPPPLPPLKNIRTPHTEPGWVFQRQQHGLTTVRGGETEAMNAVSAFLGQHIHGYRDQRDILSSDGTSRLSHHLATGSLSVRTLLHLAMDALRSAPAPAREGISTFINELLWREFFYHVMWHFPYVADRCFKTEFDTLRWETNEQQFEAWRTGMTGYPIVDAAMRQLQQEHWMHNRGRMIVASFLTKHLHIDWRRGERYFLSMLADGDRALNNGGWQWSAGTGTDAQPWFRIFNPVLQGKKFDPHGTYVKRYLPELINVPEQYIHEPWRMTAAEQNNYGCILDADYPSRIVLHEEERSKTLRMYQSMKSFHRNHTSSLKMDQDNLKNDYVQPFTDGN